MSETDKFVPTNAPTEVEQDNIAYKQAILGMKIEGFLNSEVGTYVTDRAIEQIDENSEKLRECNPGDADLITELQNNCMVAKLTITWLLDAVEAGEIAYQNLREQENE